MSLIRDLSAARVHLERAYYYLGGNEEACCKAREALDLLIEMVATAEHARPVGDVIQFPRQSRN
ncbi:hypothetical protein [Aquamicrobium ahrensii]|uniref:HEPN domain-containing protein n=1 Tax=Aquamicrobium ahrensii TaxID=469551 RepID=A0ABV2KKW3_9HYPH